MTQRAASRVIVPMPVLGGRGRPARQQLPRQGWLRHAVHARVSERTRSGIADGEDLGDRPAHRRARRRGRCRRRRRRARRRRRRPSARASRRRTACRCDRPPGCRGRSRGSDRRGRGVESQPCLSAPRPWIISTGGAAGPPGDLVVEAGAVGAVGVRHRSAAPVPADGQPVERRAGLRPAELVQQPWTPLERVGELQLGERAAPPAAGRDGRPTSIRPLRLSGESATAAGNTGRPGLPRRRRRRGGRCGRPGGGGARVAPNTTQLAARAARRPPRRGGRAGRRGGGRAAPNGAMSGRPTKRTGRPVASLRASAVTTGSSVKRRALTTTARRRCREPLVATDGDAPAQPAEPRRRDGRAWGRGPSRRRPRTRSGDRRRGRRPRAPARSCRASTGRLITGRLVARRPPSRRRLRAGMRTTTARRRACRSPRRWWWPA